MVRYIRIKRKAHPRKGYTKKNRIRVKGTHVRKTIYLAKDRGKYKGRAPKYKRWHAKAKVSPVHKIVGYKIRLPLKKRRRILNGEVRQRARYGAARYKNLGKTKEGALSVKRYLQMKRNVNRSRKARQVFQKDINFIEGKYGV